MKPYKKVLGVKFQFLVLLVICISRNFARFFWSYHESDWIHAK